MERDTQIGGSHSELPRTRHSIVRAAGSADAAERARAWEAIVAGYWKPVYKYLRVRFARSNEDAKDLTQGFFARAMEKDFFAGFDPAKAKFRTFLRTCVDGFVANEDKAQRAQKRGGGRVLIALDFAGAEDELKRGVPPAADELEDYFRTEWVRSVFAAAVDELRRSLAEQGKEAMFELFRRYDLERSAASYEELARQLDLEVTTVTNRLAAVRRELRRLVLERVRALTATEEEFRDEVRAVLGIEPP